jgi:hypothetical protein
MPPVISYRLRWSLSFVVGFALLMAFASIEPGQAARAGNHRAALLTETPPPTNSPAAVTLTQAATLSATTSPTLSAADAAIQALFKNALLNCAENPVNTFTPDEIRNSPNVFAWFAFLHLNCPLIGSFPPIVNWEAWRSTYTVYLPNGARPPYWGASFPRVLDDIPEISGHTVLDKSGQPILYEVKMNRGTFDYIYGRGLYSKACQINWFNGNPCDGNVSAIQFPREAFEIKAAWIILKPGDPKNSRYYTVQSRYQDKNGAWVDVLAGLGGLHVTSKALPNWVWATFEQVDNQQNTDSPVVVPTPPEVQEINDLFHNLLKRDNPNTIWQYYILRGTQIDFTNPDGSPTILANTLIESNFQKSSSCITCHALSTRGSASEGRLPFFNVTSTGVQGYVGSLSDPNNKYFDAFETPVCYSPQTNNFVNCQTGALVYKTMDFVWSFREAQ